MTFKVKIQLFTHLTNVAVVHWSDKRKWQTATKATQASQVKKCCREEVEGRGRGSPDRGSVWDFALSDLGVLSL